ncbi:MAG: hypothetical protein AAFN63_10780 [Pseudomonadota bacterium]
MGKVLEALQALSAATDTPLPEIDKLVEKVEEVKGATKAALRAEAEAALKRLKAVDEEAWKKVCRVDATHSI